MPLVSVVLIFLNEERFIAEAVRSVFDQTLTDWELILVDDGSTDRSSQIARDLAADNNDRVQYVEHPGHENRGMAASRNFGAANGSARYLAFIDADDVWEPVKLAEQVALLEQMPDVAMVNGAMRYWYSWDPTSNEADVLTLTGGLADRRLDPPEAALAISLGPADRPGVDLLVRRNVFEAVGGFDERFPGMLEDQTFITRVFLKYPVYISSRPWLQYRQHDESTCARATRVSYVRARGDFLASLEDDVARLEDARVSATLRYARRQIRYKKLLAPGLQIIDLLRARIPDGYGHRLLDRVPDRYQKAVLSRTTLARDLWRQWWL